MIQLNLPMSFKATAKLESRQRESKEQQVQDSKQPAGKKAPLQLSDVVMAQSEALLQQKKINNEKPL